MNRLKIAKYGIPLIGIGLLISLFYGPKLPREQVEQKLFACVTAICYEQDGGAGPLCEKYPARMSKIMLMRDSDSGARTLMVKMSDTVCNN